MYYTFLKCIANICKRAETAKFSALTKVKVCFNYCVFQKFLYGHYIIKLFTHAREEKNFCPSLFIFQTCTYLYYE